MDTGSLVGLLGGTGIGAIFASIVAGLFSKKKLGAEATKIITDAAAGVVTSISEDLERAKLARDRAEQKLADREIEYQRDRAAHRAVLQLHASWDVMAIAKLKECGIELPEPPPLLPPHL